MRPYASVDAGRRCEPKTTNSHLLGASFAYDGVHAKIEKPSRPNRIIVRVRSQPAEEMLTPRRPGSGFTLGDPRQALSPTRQVKPWGSQRGQHLLRLVGIDSNNMGFGR